MILSQEQIKELQQVSSPLIKFLKQFHPHVKVIVDSDSAELLEGSALIKETNEMRLAITINKNE